MSNEEILKDNNNKKFDICLMNPPYGNGIYKSFLNKVLEISTKSITIHPADFILGKKQNKDILNKLSNGFNLEIINSMSDFDAGIWGTLSILYHNGNGKYIYNKREFTNIEDIKPWSNDKFIEDFINIIKPLADTENIDEHVKSSDNEWCPKKYREKNPNNNWWCIRISQLRGNQSKTGVQDDYYTFIPKERSSEQYKNIINNIKYTVLFYIPFENKNTCDNFINYLKTDFARTCLKAIKTTGQLMRGELKYIPWFDFSDEHFNKSPKEIDNWLFEKYNISDEIRKHIEEILPDYYNIR